MKLFQITNNQKGFAHHILIPAAVLVLVTVIGVKILTASHADPLTSTITNDAATDATTTGYEFLDYNSAGSGLTDANVTIAGLNGTQAAVQLKPGKAVTFSNEPAGFDVSSSSALCYYFEVHPAAGDNSDPKAKLQFFGEGSSSNTTTISVGNADNDNFLRHVCVASSGSTITFPEVSYLSSTSSTAPKVDVYRVSVTYPAQD